MSLGCCELDIFILATALIYVNALEEVRVRLLASVNLCVTRNRNDGTDL